MSSAILYLAIVAIWAVVLVPRWLHPRAAQPEPAEQPEEPTAPPAEASVSGDPRLAAPADDGWPEPAETEPGDPAWAEDSEPAPASSPAQVRADVLQARRRILATLIVLTAGAVGLAVTRIAAFWVIGPPAALLAGFLVLLRAASHIDSERNRRATGIHAAAPAPVAGQEPESFHADVQASPDPVPVTASAPDVAEPPSGAEVIDISGRIVDQVYDQYSDAADRAVGD